jgi:hypothetical protein
MAVEVPQVSVYDKLLQKIGLYYQWSIHPRVRNVNKESIIHHCQYSEPQKHIEALQKLGVTVKKMSDLIVLS